MRIFPSQDGMSVEKANKILGAIIIAGFLTYFFVGEIALKLSAFIAASVMMSWLIIDYVRDVRSPLRRRSWGAIFVTTVEYMIPWSIVIIFLVMVFNSIAQHSG
jgi:hypothetical protein